KVRGASVQSEGLEHGGRKNPRVGAGSALPRLRRSPGSKLKAYRYARQPSHQRRARESPLVSRLPAKAVLSRARLPGVPIRSADAARNPKLARKLRNG